MKYKVGDIVKLRDDLEGGIEIGDYYYSHEMSNFKGEKVTIVEADEKGKNYSIEEDRRLHYWTDEMIEGLWEERKPKLKLIDILNKIANGELKEGTKVIYKGEEYTYRKDSCSPEEYDLYIKDRLITISDNCYLSNLNDEVELIEPDHFTDVGKMAECEHEWAEYAGYNAKTGESKHYRECVKCGVEEELPDNTTEKIEELDLDEFALGTAIDYRIAFKLNEVIRKINKEGNNE